MVYKIVKSDELYHFGVKGMKWGVRKDRYTKDQIQKRRSELIAQAPKSDGKRRSASSPPTKGYWKNASDAQISRLMDYEAKQNSKQNAARIKKGAKFAGKVLVGAAATYAVVKLPNTKTFIKGSSKAAELLIKPIPGTRYLARQAALADKFDIAAGVATKAAAAGMVGTTAYKFNKKYKVSRRA